MNSNAISNITTLNSILPADWLKKGTNTFGANTIVGLFDAFSLGIRTSNIDRIFIAADGKTGFGNSAPNSNAQFTGSLSLSYTTKTSTYTLTASDYAVDCTANTFTITLPTYVGISGRIYQIKNSGTGVITVDTTSSELIDGSLFWILNPSSAGAIKPNMTIQATNTGWIFL